MKLTLYNQCRSGPSHRVRIALALKGLGYDYVPIDIRRGAQHSDDFVSLNPQGLVPALCVDGRVLTQSGPIIEWLEEQHPSPSLFPADAWDRAIVRSMSAVIGSDIQPLNNLRVQAHLRERLSIDDQRISAWVFRWMADGFTALERLVERHRGDYCFGDNPTTADVYLVPQVCMAERLGFDMSAYPVLSALASFAQTHPAFRTARPEIQPDWS
jgi:maleylacetoacetate isomerase